MINKRYTFPFYFLLIFLLGRSAYCGELAETSINIIPRPLYIEIRNGNFSLNENTVLIVPESDALLYKQALFFNSAIEISTGFKLAIQKNHEGIKNNFIRFEVINDKKIGGEGYSLNIKKDFVIISANNRRGIFYGIQTLLQLLPAEVFSLHKASNIKWDIPCLSIKDKPQYHYRGMHLDVSRHFFSKEFIKKYIDLMAMYKMNYFHWHLTDDNGWRIEIKKYPLLTQICAWRVNRENQPWGKWAPIRPGEKSTYGGYYTQDDIKEIVKYAADRFITIIPELEMPAHTSEIFAAYPQYSCKGDTLNVCPGSYWPNKDIFCAGNDSTFTFIENILTEVSSLFPGPYIHIGGDEADKTYWEECPKCRTRIKNEGLKSSDDLQSYFIGRINNILLKLHKKMIGWDEIMEGGLAKDATVMCWNSIDKGVEAAKMGNDVIMTPTKYCYFDYYQANPLFDSLGTGELITLNDIYSFNPSPAGLTKQESRHILGAQANLWTELVKTEERAEYMILPRIAALAEDVWLPGEIKNWGDFLKRIYHHFKIYNIMGLNYSHGSYTVKINPEYKNADRNFIVSLSSEQLNQKIYYTLNGKDLDTNSFVYQSPVTIDKTTTIKSAILNNNSPVQGITEKTIYIGKELDKKILYAYKPAKKYSGDNGFYTLIDGVKGTTYYYDGNWQGFSGKDVNVIIDLGEPAKINNISLDFLNDQSKWIFVPERVTISVSPDGINYVDYKMTTDSANQRKDSIYVQQYSLSIDQSFSQSSTHSQSTDHSFNQSLNPSPVRFVHIIAKNIGVCPDWHAGAGEEAWLFCDEVLIE